MTPEDIAVFNHNVEVQNHNAQLFENITRSLVETNDIFINTINDMVFYNFLQVMIICLLMVAIVLEMQSLENKVKKLERDKV